MSQTSVGAAAQALNKPNLGRDTLIGGVLGSIIRQPVLGALAGAATNLLRTEGMAEGMKAVASNVMKDLGNGTFDVQKAVDSLGPTLFGADKSHASKADPQAADRAAKTAEKKSGIPGWAKLIAGGGAFMLFANLFDNFSMNGFGNPLFGGYGMDPFMGSLGMGMMDPMGMGMGMGMGMPSSNIVGGMGAIDLLLAGGLGYGAYKLFSS